MEVNMRAEKDERPPMIILGVVVVYLLIFGFITYLSFLKKIHPVLAVAAIIIFTVIYLPRFMIIRKLFTEKDKVEIIEDYIMINGVGYNFSDIGNYRIRQHKPVAVFYLNNKMIVFNEAEFFLYLQDECVCFTVIGSEKIELLKEYMENTLPQKL